MKTLVVIPAFAVTAFVIGEAMKIFRSIQMKYALLMEILGAMSLEIKRLTESNRQQREMIEELTIQQSNELETAQSDSNEHLSQLNNTNQSLQEQMKESGEKLQPSQLKIQALTIDLDTASTEKSNVNEKMNQLEKARDDYFFDAESLKLELETSGELEMGLRQALKDQADATQSLVTELETTQSTFKEQLSQLNDTNQSLEKQMKESGDKLQPSELKIQALTIDLDTASTEKSNVNEEMNQLTVSRDEAIVKADSLKLELDNLSDTVEQEKTHRHKHLLAVEDSSAYN